MNYCSVTALNRLCLQWARRIARDFDLIVGVPRSGLLAANLLALHANLPLTDVDGLLEDRLMHHGRRSKKSRLDHKLRVLIVDDCVNTGGQLRALRERIASAALPHDIRYGAAYINPGQEDQVDQFGEALVAPRIYEWNLMTHTVLLSSCLDIDGVLCEDPTNEQDDDGERYCDFLRTATPLSIPGEPVGWLVTSRLEKFRKQTEQWLAANNVQYRELVMMDLPDKAARASAPSAGTFKASVYRATNADLFVESDPLQTIEIANLSGKPVLCFATGELIKPDVNDNFPMSTDAPINASAALPRGGDVDESSWTARLQAGLRELLQIVPKGESVIVMDDWQWGLDRTFASRTIRPFIERDGQYWGPPDDDDAAIAELERMRQRGDHYAVVAWPAFWWLEQYPRFAEHLRSHYRCPLENRRLIAFDLREQTR